jgi:sugar phosphate isomerase/epimerase
MTADGKPRERRSIVAPTIACNTASYGPYQNRAFEHLAKIGIRAVEIPCPEARDVDRVRRELDRCGLAATSVMVPCQMDADDVTMRFSYAMDRAAGLGARLVFTSTRTAELDVEYVYGRLQTIGDAAADRGMTVVLETHPDLATNGEVAAATMRGVGHPNVRINFDTANVYYYNEGVTAEGELAKVIDFVGAVHLKDTDGGYRSWHFPALGEGVVNFPAVFAALSTRGFDGPCTMEIEGIRGERLTEDLALSRVTASLAYLRELGLTE